MVIGMKAIIEFNLPEDAYEYENCNKALQLRMFQEETYDKIRSYLKYATLKEHQAEILEELKEWLDQFKVDFENN